MHKGLRPQLHRSEPWGTPLETPCEDTGCPIVRLALCPFNISPSIRQVCPKRPHHPPSRNLDASSQPDFSAYWTSHPVDKNTAGRCGLFLANPSLSWVYTLPPLRCSQIDLNLAGNLAGLSYVFWRQLAAGLSWMASAGVTGFCPMWSLSL